jgi:hypothetical protein
MSIGEAIELTGAVHVHTPLSDGEMLSLSYIKSLGYGFIVITDHDIVPKNLPDYDLLIIPGVEETCSHSHILAFDVKDQSYSADEMTVIDFHKKNGSLTCLAHPGFPDKPSQDILDSVDLIEAFNGLGGGSHNMISPNKLAIAGADAHNKEQLKSCHVVVNASEASKRGVLDAIRSGKYYIVVPFTLTNVQSAGLYASRYNDTVKAWSNSPVDFVVYDEHLNLVDAQFGLNLTINDASPLLIGARMPLYEMWLPTFI